MGKSARSARSTPTTAVADGDLPVVGQREPCPCGSGRKYKACHGRGRTALPAFVARPFAGLAGEADWVAMREVVPAATAVVRLAAGTGIGVEPADGVTEATVASVLPLAWPGLRRADGRVFVGLQTSAGTNDPSRDVGAALALAAAAEPATPISTVPAGSGPRLQELLAADRPLQVTVHDGFDFWVDNDQELDPQVRDSLERANAAVIPTARLTSVDAAYWCRIGDRTHLRWVLPQGEDELLDAIARLHAAGASSLGDGTRYVGAFRAHGLLVPVWDLPADAVADHVEQPAADFAVRLQDALAADAPLTYDERRARAGVVSRQLTLR